MNYGEQIRRLQELMAELEAKRAEFELALRLQVDQTAHYKGEAERLSELLHDAQAQRDEGDKLISRLAEEQRVTKAQFKMLEGLRAELREAQREAGTMRECRDTWKAQAEALLARLRELGETGK